MPLFGRRLFHLNEDDKTENEEVFTIEHTGETFHSRSLYEKIKKVYELERWTCECTWRASLTHRDAYESEIETRKSLKTIVPEYFHKTIFEIIHHNVKPLEKLAEEVSILLGQSFVFGEPVQFKKRKDTTVVKGTVERIEENDERKRISERASAQIKALSDKQIKNVKYAIRLADENRVISNVQPNELQRTNFVPNREKLKTFIRSYAIRLGNRADSPWIFYDDSIPEKYQIKDRISPTDIDKSKKAMTITLDEILREQERIVRKQTEEQAALTGETKKTNENNTNASSQNGHHNDERIVLSDDEDKAKSPKKKVRSTPTTPKKSSQSTTTTPTKKPRTSTKQKTPTKTKKQLTLHDMKFAKNSTSNSNNLLLQKSSSTSVTTYNIAVPYSLLQKLDKTRRDRGIDSRVFQRLVLHCARTLNDKQRLRLPDEYRSLIQSKYEELELKQRLSEMTEQEKKSFLQTKQKQKQFEKKPLEDLDITSSKMLPQPKQLQPLMTMPSHYTGDLLVICTFFTSCHSLFFSTLTDDLPKTTQQFLRSFKHESLLQAYLTSSTTLFFNHFIELLQILMKLLFKEDESRSNRDDNNNNNNEEDDKQQQQQQQQITIDQQDMETNSGEQIVIDDDIEQAYDVKLNDIPLTQFTCQELTRLYLLKGKDDNHRNLLDKLANSESKDFSILEQIDLLMLLVNSITNDSEIMSDYFEYLTRTMTETYRERNQLLAERRKAQEEESKQKKLQLQNGEHAKVSSKKTGPLLTPKNSSGIANDENHQSSPSILHDDTGDIESGGDDDLKTVIQRRRQMVAMSKELKEKRELEVQKLHNEQKRELAIQKAEQAYQEALLNLQFGFRIKPLGFDRNYSRYWFFKGHPGLFVEKGWIGSEISYSTRLSSSSSSSQDISSPRSSSAVNGEKLIPKDEVNLWWTYDNETVIEQVLQSLNNRGIREHDLLENLKKIMPLLRSEFEQVKKQKAFEENPPEESVLNNEASNDQQQQQQQSNDIISSFKNDLEDIEQRLRLGSLGGFIVNDNLIEWQTKLKQSNERADLAELLIQLQQTIAEKHASGIFGTHENRSKSSKNTSKKKALANKSSLTNQHNLQMWMNDCRTCKTYSRLYVLMMIFENSIAWSKSTIGIKCKICRRKHKDEYIVVCDQCCQGYHFECLRGYTFDDVKNSTNDLWYCPACRPQSVSRRRNDKKSEKKAKMDYYDADIYDMDVDTRSNQSSHDNNQDLSDLNSEQSHQNHHANPNDDDDDGEESNIEVLCCVCGGEAGDDNELIQCIQCRSLFHCQCHEPPLRCAPRSTTWMCTSCRNGVNNETNLSTRRSQTRRQMAIKKRNQTMRVPSHRQNETRRTTRKNYRELDEDEYDDEEDVDFDKDDESDYEQESRNQRRSKRLRRSSPSLAIDDSYDTRRSTRRRVRIARSSSSSASSSAVSDEEEILANLNDDDNGDGDDDDEISGIEEDEYVEEQENGNIEAISPSSQ